MLAGLRGLLWVASLVGIGSWFGGDTVEGDKIETKDLSWLDWIVITALLCTFIWFLVWLYKKYK